MEDEKMTVQEVALLIDWLRAQNMSEEQITDCIAYIAANDDEGMTDVQYKGILLDQLDDWQETLELAVKAGNTEIQEKVEKQIAKINKKLEF